jgi:alpha/beta superfamily hydrolase
VTTESPNTANTAGAGGQDDQVEVRSGTVLRARREDIELHTADGLTLVGELALPPDRDPVATLVTLHPLPTHGGFMDSHVLRKASYRLPALADIAVLRFNTRGTTSPRGTSGGTFDEARSERFDVAAAIEFAEFHDLPHRWLLGWSFGTDLALMHGHDPAVEGAILLSPPLRFSGAEHLQAWADGGKPLVALVPEHDDYLRPAEAARRFAAVPQARVVGVEGGRHLWVGETLVRRALDEIVAVVAPDRGPLPRTVPASLVAPDSADSADATDPADTGTDAGTDAADAARG